MCFVIFSFRAQKLAEYDINLAKLMELASFNSDCCIYICIIPTPPLFFITLYHVMCYLHLHKP